MAEPGQNQSLPDTVALIFLLCYVFAPDITKHTEPVIFSRVFYLLLKKNSNIIFEVKKQITQSMTLISCLLNTGKIDYH